MQFSLCIQLFQARPGHSGRLEIKDFPEKSEKKESKGRMEQLVLLVPEEMWAQQV